MKTSGNKAELAERLRIMMSIEEPESEEGRQSDDDLDSDQEEAECQDNSAYTGRKKCVSTFEER